jgi:hypothetical protein
MQTRNVKLDRCAMKNNYKQQVINPLLFIFIKHKKSLKIPKGVIRIRISTYEDSHIGKTIWSDDFWRSQSPFKSFVCATPRTFWLGITSYLEEFLFKMKDNLQVQTIVTDGRTWWKQCIFLRNADKEWQINPLLFIFIKCSTYSYLFNQFNPIQWPLKLWVRTPFIARCTRYNIMW